MARAAKLKFKGTYNDEGQPDRWYMGLPARDLDESETAALSDDEYANAIGGDHPLYVEVPHKDPPKAPAKEDDKDNHVDHKAGAKTP